MNAIAISVLNQYPLWDEQSEGYNPTLLGTSYAFPSICLKLKKRAVPLSYLVNDPFAEHLFPGTLDVIPHLRRWGQRVILSDGDVVFQPRRIQRSGLWDGVEDRVLFYVHKEQMLQDVEQRYSARHYVMVDDKLRILVTTKDALENRLTTGFPHQSHYALEPGNIAASGQLDDRAHR